MSDNTQPTNEEAVPIKDTAKSDFNNPDVINPDVLNPKNSYEGRKHQPDIDGPQQASQETDEIFVDPRKQEDLPDGGKNVADLNAYDLSQNGNQ